jgi:RNA polymerase sigma factor (sigma-70 family)
MGPAPLDPLVEKLSRGDAEAIEETVRAHEGFLRLVVRRQLAHCFRARFDSIDIVHSVWLRLLPGLRAGRWRFTDVRELRAFLVRATRNHLINRIRRAVRELSRDRAGAGRPAADDPGAGGGAEEEELWQQLLSLCPPAHHELLRLKREGVPLAEIAARTGLHPSSVRRILYDLMRRLRAGQDADPARTS